MKKTLYIFLVLMVLGGFIAIFAYINQDKLIDRFIERQSKGVLFQYELLEKPGMTLITVGTGSPLPSQRRQSCIALFVNGHFFVFDVGEGGSKGIENMRLPIDKIDGVFISHWHSDHFIDLSNLISRSWQLGRSHVLPIYGPEGLDSIISGIDQMLSLDIKYRSLHNGPEIMNPSVANGVARTIHIDSTQSALVYDKDGVKITAFLVDHSPVNPSLGYRIEYGGRSVVLSGDTKKSENLVKYAKNADLLIHEALQSDFIQRASVLQAKLGNSRNAIMAKGMLDYHSNPRDAAEVAKEAGVKKLVLTHLTPAPENPISRRFYRTGLDKIYSGPILLAEDGDVYYIK